MRPILRVLIPFALAAAALFAWVESGRAPRGPAPESEPAPKPRPEPAPAKPPQPVTGTLVIRVRTEDGKDLPEATRAGYVGIGGDERLRPAAADGTFRFSDAPVGPVDVVAEAPGYDRAHAGVVVVPGVSTETVVTLAASK